MEFKKKKKKILLKEKIILEPQMNYLFRLLNLMLYIHLFFNNILGNINDKDMKLYTHGDLTCFNMIENNWEIKETILNDKGINNIKIFMNIIFDKFTVLLRGAGDMSSLENRQKIETDIRNYIEALIKNRNA